MSSVNILFLISGFLLLANTAWSQAGEICSDTGGSTIWLNSRVVYGKVILSGLSDARQAPKVSITLTNGTRITSSTVIDKSGNYCFRDTDGSGATLVVEVEGREVGREILETGPPNVPKQFRRDFEIQVGNALPAKPSVISAKYPYSRGDSNSKLYSDAESAISEKELKKAEGFLRKIVENDPDDFWAWAKLGSLYLEQNDLPGAEKALQRSIAPKPDFAPALVNLGRVYLLQKRFESAIEVLNKATELEPNAARAFQLLGEAYLMVKKGTLGVEALYEAIRLEPIAMAECHLLIALLYDRAGAKDYASREYRIFLEKVPKHPDAKKFSDYIKANPPVR